MSQNSIAGAAADTGTLPDSAPHTPLNTLVVSPVAAICVNTVSGRADNIDASHQLVGTPIRINSPHHDRQHLKRLRQIARGQRESALDVFEVQAVGLSLLLDFVNEAGTQLGVRKVFEDVTIRLPWRPTGICPAWARP